MKSGRKLIKACDRKIIALIADGYDHIGISKQLGIREVKVKRHIQTMMEDHGFTTPFQLITWAYHDAILI